MLVKSGANVNERDLYGRPLLQRARNLFLDEVVAELLALGADPKSGYDLIPSCVERSVQFLSQKLTQSSSQEYPGEVNRRRWLILGRCLFLGNDIVNATIATEQSTVCCTNEPTCDMCKKSRREISYRKAIVGGMCHGQTIYHICKAGDDLAICEDVCVKKHWEYLKDSDTFETHEYLRYPRPWFDDVPKGYVALVKDTYVPTDDWLKTLKEWKCKNIEGPRVLKRSTLGVWLEEKTGVEVSQ
jgi:hypothetical protein